MSTKKLQILGSFGSGSGSESSITIDPTLTQVGKAADAKATGDKFSNLETQINNIDTLVGDTSVADQISDVIDGYYTKTETDAKLSGKADSSHGNHVPTTETTNNAKFLRNDNTWQIVTPENIGALPITGGEVAGTVAFYNSAMSTRHAEIKDGTFRFRQTNQTDAWTPSLQLRKSDDSAILGAYGFYKGNGDTLDYYYIGNTSVSPLFKMTPDGTISLASALPVASGGTGAKDAATARSNLGITPANIGAATTAQFNSLSSLVGDTAVSTQISNYAPSKTGSGASGNWAINITGSSGSCTGNAATASAVAWTGVSGKPSYYDAKAIKGITRSGTTFTYTCMDGTTGTFTQQDNNNTYTLSSFGITATATELNYVDGVTSNVQTQLNNITSKVGDTAVSTQISNAISAITPASIGAAASSHGTHVSYGTSASALGTSSAGSATTVSRSDHVHALPALTSCTGTLTVAKGGTGLTASPSMLVNLGSTSAANVLQASPRPGITGTLGVANGGTGATSKSGARTNLGITSGTALPSSASAGDIFFLYS